MSKPLAVVLEGTIEEGCTQAEANDLRGGSDEIAASLQELGYRTEIVCFTFDTNAIRAQIAALAPDVVFNLVDSVEGKGNLISMAPMLLTHMDLPFTGATALATTTSCDKLLSKQILRACNVPTPDWLTEAQIDAATGPELNCSYILKSITEHASFGMFADSVVNDRATLKSRWQEKKAKYGTEWFAEAYVEGREFNQSVLAKPNATALPSSEIVFTKDFPSDKPKIVDYAAKWYTDTAEYKGSVRSFDYTAADQTMLKAVQKTALDCWEAFGLTGYARVDIRVAADGTPYVIDVNSNPCLSASEGFGVAAAKGGIPFTQAIRFIVEDAYRRSSRPMPKLLAA